MEGKIENLKKKLDDAEKVLSNDDDDLRAMFYNLKDGLQNINEKVNNPTCYWNGCNAGTFNSLSALLNHVDSEHAFQEDHFYVWSLISIETTIHFKYVFNTD